MKITDIKAYTMDAFRTNWTFIKVETDEGLYGWGEASLGTREHALEGCVDDLKRMILGRNPIDIEKMWFEVYRDSYWKGGPVMMSALSGIEIACWDTRENSTIHPFAISLADACVKKCQCMQMRGLVGPARLRILQKRQSILFPRA